MTNNIIKSATFGEFSIHPKYNIPVIEILVDNEVSGYMTPFRGYFFQVSETYDGEYDMGNSINYGRHLHQYLTGNKDIDEDIFKALATTCLIKFSNVWSVYYKNEKLILDIRMNPRYGQEDSFTKFIQASIDWVKLERFGMK